MTFEECVKEFPIWKTIIGEYKTNLDFTIYTANDIDNIEHWNNIPLEWPQGEGPECSYPFIVYVGNNKFECYFFSGIRVCGYLNETENPNLFFPATYSNNFQWEAYNFTLDKYKNMRSFTPNYELRDELVSLGKPVEDMTGHDWMNEQVAYTFDSEKYLNGEIFTTFDQIKEFVHANY